MLERSIGHFSIPKSADTRNADAVGIHDFGGNSFSIALADGVGKSAYSSEAAELATRTAISHPFSTDLKEVFESIRVALKDAASRSDGAEWSTTLTMCRYSKGIVEVGHVGDSRLYHIRNNGLITRTRDQTEIQALIDEGVLSKERAKKYPRKNVLLSALSSSSSFDLFVTSFEAIPGDRLLLVTDGLYRQVPRKEIAAMSAASSTVGELIEHLKIALESRGLVDDSTALCVEIEK